MAAPLANGTLENGAVAHSSSDDAPVNGPPDGLQGNHRKLKEAERRRRRRKQKKKGKAGANDDNDDSDEEATHKDGEQVEVEYVSEKPNFNTSIMDPLFHEFVRVFDKFSFAENMFPVLKKDENMKQDAPEKVRNADSDDDEEDEQDAKLKEKGLSNKKKKLQRRMKIAELKQQCSKPDVVEVWDATAADPKLLVYLKAYRNTVPVPRHWCQKRKFLQGAALQQL